VSSRVSRTERARVAHRAEAEIGRYLGDHLLWHKHVHNVELDPVQVLKMIEMDRNPNTVDVSCRRTGKTAVKELHALEFNATTAHQEVGIVAPRQQQAQTNLNYHLDAIRRSPMLRAFMNWKSGREQLTDTRYQFYNGSKAQAYGIMSQIDGDSLSYASIEEIDDMPAERLLSRFLPMLGSARRLGVRRDASFKPQIRITGVFKGADTLQHMIDSGQYHLLPTVNVYLGIELGIINEAFMLDMRAQLPEGEYIRQFLCRNVSSQNHIWERYIRLAMAVGLKAGLAAAGPLPGVKYKKRGLLSFGYDHLGHGESLHASKSCLVVAEQIGGFTFFAYVRYWPAGTDEKIIEADLVGLWEYFNPDYAIGDAYGIGLLTSVNDKLFARGLTQIDRRTIGEGQSTATTWQEWAFAPIRFEGMTKHSMASALRSIFHNAQAAIPFIDDGADALKADTGRKVLLVPPSLAGLDPDASAWTLFIRQLNNIRAEATKVSYASYKMANTTLGDDGFDAAMAAVWALVTRGVLDIPTVISHRTQTREQLLGVAPRLPARAAA